MKSSAIIPHHPKQILNLLVDSKRRQNFEPNVAVSERLELLNTFTFLDYYAYRGEALLDDTLRNSSSNALLNLCLSLVCLVGIIFQLSGL